MHLQEFVQDQIQLVEDFQHWYETKRKRRQLSMFNPEQTWIELLDEYVQSHRDQGETDGKSETKIPINVQQDRAA